MVRGLPGSGKSFLSEAVAKEIDPENVLILDPDTINLNNKTYQSFSSELTKEGLDEAIHPFRWSRKMACDAVVEGKIVIWNQPFTIRGIFDRLVLFIRNHAEENGIDLPVLLVEIDIDHDKAKRRIADRKQAGGHGPTDRTFARRADEYESFADDYETVTLHGENDINQSVKMVLDALAKLTS